MKEDIGPGVGWQQIYLFRGEVESACAGWDNLMYNLYETED